MTAHHGATQPIRLDISVQRLLGKHLLTSYPQEACGILLGAAAAGGMLINSYVPVSNVAPDPLHAFVPDPGEWVHILYNEPDLIGLFHSHPNTAPWPSPADLKGLPALGPEFRVYLIGAPGSDSSKSPEFNGFHIVRGMDPVGRTTHQLLQAPLYDLLK
jgi:proteasome lid subunit RPN8/RPN11